MSEQQAQGAMSHLIPFVDQESEAPVSYGDELTLLLKEIALTEQGLRSEVIGGCGADTLGAANPLDVEALKEFYVQTRYDPEQHGELTDFVRSQILSEICVTEADARRADQARQTIAGHLDMAAMMDDPEVADGMRQLARMEMPSLVPNVLHVDKNRVIEVIQNDFRAAFDSYLSSIADAVPVLIQEASAVRFNGSAIPELPVDPENRQKWLGCLVESVRDSLNTRLGISLSEAFVNNLMHGNKGDPDKIVSVFFGEENGGVRYVVHASDQGEGFVREEVRDPTAEENLERASGRGILLMSKFLSDVSYSDGGRTVTLRVDFDSAIKEGFQEGIGHLHDVMRKDAFQLLSNEIVEPGGAVSSFVATVIDFELGPHIAERLKAVCADLGEGYLYAAEGKDFAALRQEIKESALNQSVRTLERKVKEFVTDSLRNEYRVDVEAPVLITVGRSQVGERTLLTVTTSAEIGDELHDANTTEFPARRYSPPDTRIPFLSKEGIKAFCKAGLFGQLPPNRVDIDLQEEIEAALVVATNTIARRHFKVEKPAEPTETKQE